GFGRLAGVGARGLVTVVGALDRVFVLAGVGQAFDRDHVLLLRGAEDDHALGVAAGDADLADRSADQLALVGDQQDLVAVLDREGGREPAAALAEVLGQQ